MRKIFTFIDRFIVSPIVLVFLAIAVFFIYIYDFARKLFDPAYEDDYERITRKQNARMEFDKRNIYPKRHTTHYCCDEIINLHGGKAKGCCCTGHKCKK